MVEEKGTKRKDFSVVIPVFNEEGNLDELYRRLKKVFESLGCSYEIIFVDDGSKDNSFEIITRLKGLDENVVGIQLTRNFGQHPAIASGLSLANGEIVVIMDADLQNPPEEIPKLVSGIKEGYDLVFGVRRKRRDSLVRRMGSRVAEAMLNRILGVETSISAFMAVSYPFVESFNQCPERNKFFPGLFTWLGARVKRVEIEHFERKAGETKYSFGKLIRLFITMIISFSEIPLRVASRLGILVSFVGLVLAIKVLVQKLLLEIAVPGYASIFAAVVLFSGVQLFFLGIFGEYLARIYIETRRRPDYIIRKVLR